MEEFPFTDEEWDRVSEAALPVVNAGLADDMVLRESAIVHLWEVLDDLERKFGQHPVIVETRADFVDDERERIRLYTIARIEAERMHIPIHTIQISLADVYVEFLDDPDQAIIELNRCAEDVAAFGHEHERKDFDKLKKKCQTLIASRKRQQGTG